MMLESETVTEDETVAAQLSPQERGEKIAAMVNEEEAAVLAEEAAQDEEEVLSYPCPVCGGPIDLPHVPQQDPSTERCPVCLGFGMTATGSLAPDMQVAQCTECQGRGYRSKSAQYTPLVPAPEQPREGDEEPAQPPIEIPGIEPVDISQVKLA